ncbi:XRE family transcriptional regulator [Amycolatopsis balhimycina DSM 5908]|uniref:XRE family transcriptional regulator n=1 Tax=Amycolatopsis balhimycina DSM 5908 TaxID=1081091 RepID=A0A428VYH5_AMYBA|nr:helix-turn-helix transcriptional regulator [Amycolatopsis balhimycina]RSM35867.1 XRE family transcriptional regulator [Amycolatopsis balhimycina DSM 5908]
MDALHPFWTSPEVLRAAAEGRYGMLARAVREARHWTLAQVAVPCHLSVSTLSRMETGQRTLSDVHYLRTLSEVLAIPPHLFGLAPVVTGAAEEHDRARTVTVRATSSGSGQGGDEAMRRRQVLAGLAGFTIAGVLPGTARAASSEESLEALLLTKSQLPATPVPLMTLHHALGQAQHAFERCEYSELTSALPRLIAAAHASRDSAAGQLRERMSAALARAYLLGSELATKRHRDTVARVAADRSHAAAEASGDPLTIAASSRAIAISMRRHALDAPERIDREAGLNGAITMLTKTALDLEADHGDPRAPLLATYGSLLCTASYAAAQNGNTAQAIGLIEEAEHAARRLPGTATAGGGSAQFSETTVAVYRIGIHTALGDTATALSYFDSVEPGQLPTAERRARAYVDGARAWNAHGNLDQATSALNRAFTCAPQELQRPSVRDLITVMLDTPGRTPATLPALATHAGV